jgi:hypothetical protein
MLETHTVHFYMLYLIDYEDGRVVFTSGGGDNQSETEDRPALEKRKELFEKACGEKGVERDDFRVCDIRKHIATEKGFPEGSLRKAEIGFYHHRIIAHVEAELPDKDIRSMRDLLPDKTDHILKLYKDSVNSAYASDRVLGYYQYQLVILENSSDKIDKLDIPYSFQTTSLSFEIIKPSWREKKLLVRISLPCTTIYGDIQVDKDRQLVRDFINGIYQCALYGRKGRLESKELKVRQGAPGKEYRLDEGDLQELWNFMMEAMGGKLSHLYAFRVHRRTYIWTIAIVILTIVIVALTAVLVADIIHKLFF